MTPAIHSWEWQFGGLLHGLPPAWAWTILGGAGVLGAVAVVVSYFRSLRPLSPVRRAVLIVLRLGLLASLLLFLANPSRVEKRLLDPDARRPLAVLVDRSASMEEADNRSETRLHNAVKAWTQLRPSAEEGYRSLAYFRFGETLSAASGSDDALGASKAAPGQETHLYDALRDLLKNAPPDGYGGIVCLTDGLDTTAATAAPVVAAALPSGTPLYFVVGTNRTPLKEACFIREVKAPPAALRRSAFRVEALLNVVTSKEGSCRVSLLDGEKPLDSRDLPLRPGLNVVPVSFPVTAGDPGTMALRLVAKAGSADSLQDSAGTDVRVTDQRPIRVLFYQGAMQWGYNFFVSALRNEPGFRLDAILHPAENVQATFSQEGNDVPADLPDKADPLRRYDVVVLAHVYADRLSPAQQEALAAYARGGGGILFVAPDDDSSRLFAGTVLEQMLPATFEPPDPVDPATEAEMRFRDRMKAIGGSNGQQESLFAAETLNTQKTPALIGFAIPDGTRPSPLLAVLGGAPKGETAKADASPIGSDRPLFTDYTRLRSAKAGAEILAIHPTEHTGDGGKPRILMARQTFGRGAVTLLSTDLLWRWKMSLPPESRRVETFWQQLLLALAQPPADGLHFVKTASAFALGKAAPLRLEGGAPGAAPAVAAVAPSGKRIDLAVAGEKSGGWSASFLPDEPGRWSVEASVPADTGAVADSPAVRIAAFVAAASENRELSGQPPDVDGLRRLAEATGGAVLETGEGQGLRPPPGTSLGSAPDVERSVPLWDRQWLLALCLGLYAAELLWRRRLRLL